MRRADHFKTLPFSQISTENVEGIFLSLTREHSFPTTSVLPGTPREMEQGGEQ